MASRLVRANAVTVGDVLDGRKLNRAPKNARHCRNDGAPSEYAYALAWILSTIAAIVGQAYRHNRVRRP